MRDGCGALESRGLFRRGYRPEPIEAFWFVEREKACRDMTTVTTLRSGPSRGFVIPKGELLCRVATQLDPLDSIFLEAIVRQFGEYLEARRRPLAENEYLRLSLYSLFN